MGEKKTGEDMIEITLMLGDKYIDLRVPGQVTFERLQQLIAEAFAEKGTILPAGFVLEQSDKEFEVSGADLITSFGVGNGDRIHIKSRR